MKQLNDQYFTYRQTPVDYDGVAKLNLKGNTVAWNQLVPQFSNSQVVSGITYSSTGNGTITVSGTASATASYFIKLSQPVKAGDVVLFVLNNSAVQSAWANFYVRLCMYDGSKYAPGQTGCGAEVLNNKLYFTVPNTDTSSNPVDEWNAIQLRTNNGATVSMTIQPQLFDITVLNDSNVTSFDTFRQYYPLGYYAPSSKLLNFNGTGIKTNGRNLLDSTDLRDGNGTAWDGSKKVLNGITWKAYFNEDGYITKVVADGTATADSQMQVRFTLPYGKYYYGSMQSIDGTIANMYLWDTVVGGRAKKWNGVNNVDNCTSPTLKEYFSFNHANLISMRVHNGKTVDNLEFYPMIIFADETDTSFEPYKSSTDSYSISAYFPTGMKSAVDVYDEMSDGKAITRVGSVDLGSLTWTKNAGDGSTYHFRSAGIENLVKRPSATNVKANITCSKYENVSSDHVWIGTQGIAIRSANGYIWVYDSSLESGDADAFKTAMSGVYLNYELSTYTEQDAKDIYYTVYKDGAEQLLPVNTSTPTTSPLFADIIYYTVSDSEVPYRVFWAINSKGDRWDFTEREFKSFMNNPQGLGFSKTISVNRYGNAQSLTDITDNFPQPNGEVLFYDSSNSTRYDKYNNFVKFLSYEPITLYYKIPVSFYSRIPNTYSLECVVGTLTKTESKTDNMMNCSITYNALSFYKGEEVEISGTGTSYTINNDSDFPIGFEIQIDGTSMVNPYIQLSQNGNLYGEAKFIGKMNGTNPNVPFSKVYVNSKDCEQNVILEQGGSVLPNPMSYQDLSISNGSIYVTFVKLARGESTLTLGKDSGTFSAVTIRYTPIYRSV